MRIEQLTFTRFIAAISIVIYHYGKNIFPFDQEFVSFIFKQANIGVSYFFVLSGFVMIIAYSHIKKIVPKVYLKRRFARIYPVYFLAILLFLVYAILSQGHINFIEVLLNITMTQAWIPGKALSLNFPGWSLSVEAFFYILFPFLYNKVYSKYPLKKISIPILIVFITSQISVFILHNSAFYSGYPSPSHDFIFYFPIMHLSSFLMGNLAGLYFINYNKPKKNNDYFILIVLALIILALRFDIGLDYHNGGLSVLFVPLILLIAHNKGIITKICNWKPFIFLGEISYGIYILQVPIYRGATKLFKSLNLEHPFLKFYISLVLLIIVSALSYKYIEKPLRQKINKTRINKNSLL